MFTALCVDFSDAQGQLNSVVSVWISLKLKPLQAFMHVLISCKNEEDPIKMKALECSQLFSLVSLWGFFRRSSEANSAVHGWIWMKFELIRDFMVVLFICKNEEDPIKMKALEFSQQ